MVAGVRSPARGPPPEGAQERLIALLRQRYSPRAVFLTDSGTTALSAALIGIVQDRPGSAVALPAFSCYDVATAADGANVPVRLYDTDPHSLAQYLASLQTML